MRNTNLIAIAPSTPAHRLSTETKEMNENVTSSIRFCDEYEELLEEFLKALAAFSQLQDFREHQATSLDTPVKTMDTLADMELARTDRTYAAALGALRMHSRTCVLCEETLRLQVNRRNASAAALGAN